MRYLLLIAVLVGCTPTTGDFRPVAAVSIGIAATTNSDAPTPPTRPGECENCGGDGELGDGTVVVPCPACGGDGIVEAQDKPFMWYVDLEEAKRNSESSGLPLLLVFSSKTCVPCGALASQQGRNPTKDIIEKNFVACRLYAQEDMREFNRYQIRYYPTQIILVDGQEVKRREGFSSRTIKDYDQWLLSVVE